MQVPQLRGLIERSADDFAFLKDTIITTVSDRAKMDAFRAYFAAFRERLANDPAHAKEHAAAQEDMGRWLGAYFDDAGYQASTHVPGTPAIPPPRNAGVDVLPRALEGTDWLGSLLYLTLLYRGGCSTPSSSRQW